MWSVLLLGPAQGACAAPTEGLAIGQPLEDLLLTGLNGPGRSLSSYRGRPLIINVWASWCGPCRQEMASLERLSWRHDGHQFAVIGVSTDDYAERAMTFLSQSNSTISHFIDNKLAMEKMLGASRLPLTVLIDSQGRVVDKVYGARQWDGPEAIRLIEAAFRREVSPARRPH